MDEPSKRLLRKLAQFQRSIDAQIMFTDDKAELRYLAALYLRSARRIFEQVEGVERTKKALLRYAEELKPESEPT